MPYTKLQATFEAFNKLNVLVIGDLMIDSYLWGDVERISPEAPVPILAANNREHRLGGAANVALNIQSLGANPILCSVVGKDDHGKVAASLLQQKALCIEGIISSSQRPTTVKTRIISHGQHLLRVDEEIDAPLNKELTQSMCQRIDHVLSTFRIDAIVFEDYDKGVITPELIQHVVKKAKSKGIPTLVDPKKRNFSDYIGISFFKPNLKEFKEGLKLDIAKGDKEQLKSASVRFRGEKDIRMVMVTMAEQGVFIDDGKESHFIPAEIRDISDVSGAGDTVISVSALCLACGLKPEQVARIANMAGGLVCETPGVVPIDKEQLLEECKSKKVNLR